MSAVVPASDAPIFATSTRRWLTIGFAATFLLVAGLGGWAAVAQIAGAVVASGNIAVSSRVKEIQHREGGIVAEIAVDNGDVVTAGDLLVVLDDTQPRAGRDLVAAQLMAYRARMDRLAAERDGDGHVAFRAELARDGDAAVKEVLANEAAVFAARKETQDGKTAQLGEQVAQLGEQIRGLEAQLAAKRDEIELVTAELGDLRELGRRNLVPRSRVTEREREAVRLEGEEGELVATIAASRGKIAEIRMQVLQIETEFQREVLAEIAELSTEIATLAERGVAADDELSRVEIRAPVAGTVHELAVTTIGGVIAPGATLMKIVPQADELIVEAKISPNDVDDIEPGQKAEVMLSGLPIRETPRLDGRVRSISADAVHERETNRTYFTVRIALPEAERARIGNATLSPGMPAEVFIQTRERTVLDYLVDPLLEAAGLTFAEP